MNKTIVALFLITTAFNSFAGGDEDMQKEVNESRAAIKEFAGQLKVRLQNAIKEGGPENAIQVCNIAAPEIASTLSNKYEWKIGRTSLKTRNPKNKPDDWEQQVLAQFEQQKQEGADISKLDYYENTPEGFRYMKTIPTQGLCLTCHGEPISDPLKAKLDQLYPEDKAIGYKAGDIRGAFTILRSNY
jgi:hypothetical protein